MNIIKGLENGPCDSHSDEFEVREPSLQRYWQEKKWYGIQSKTDLDFNSEIPESLLTCTQAMSGVMLYTYIWP